MAKSPSLNAQILDGTVTTSETTVDHLLGRVPQDAFIINRAGSGNVFRGTTVWSSTQIFLQASTSITVTILLF